MGRRRINIVGDRVAPENWYLHQHPQYNTENIKGEDMRKCMVEGCVKKHNTHGYCKRHYWQMRTYGEIFGNPSRNKKDGNQYISDGDTTTVVMFDNESNETARVIIDTEDADKCRSFVWHLNTEGYAQTNINKRTASMHRLLMGLIDGRIQIDHINRNKLDNRKANLRQCTKRQNVLNTGLTSRNTTGYKGINFRKDIKKWCVHIRIPGGYKYKGGFNSPEEAALQYNQWARQFHGDFAYLNEVSNAYTYAATDSV